MRGLRGRGGGGVVGVGHRCWIQGEDWGREKLGVGKGGGRGAPVLRYKAKMLEGADMARAEPGGWQAEVQDSKVRVIECCRRKRGGRSGWRKRDGGDDGGGVLVL